ncbi:MAG: hypothetical protein EXR71_17820 [Myxococcales bacterium]|nr:hypothetical protein [Myxococcales bacterium]
MTARNVALDAVFLVTLCALAYLTGTAPASPGPAVAGLPAWAGVGDQLLDGPDAGRWAGQALAWLGGHPERLDAHRLPTWTILTAAVAWSGDLSVPLAGHLTNHLLRALIGPVAMLAGRGVGLCRLPAAAIAAVIVTMPTVCDNAARFTVDTAVTSAWLVAIAAPALGACTPGTAALAGALTALAAATHLTTAAVFPPAALLLVLGAPPGRRIRVCVAFTAAAGVTLAAVFQVFPILPWSMLGGTLSAGVATGSPAPSATGVETTRVAGVMAGQLGNLGPQFRLWFGGGLGADRLPLWALVGLAGLGVLGIGLRPRSDHVNALARWAPRAIRLPVDAWTRGSGAGVALALALLPVAALFLVGAPKRYADTLLPVALLLVGRGAASLGALAEVALVALGLRVRSGALAACAAVGLCALLGVGRAGGVARPIDPVDIATLEAATALRGLLPPDPAIAGGTPELVALTGGHACPARHCPVRPLSADVRSCADAVYSECAGADGAAVYIVVERHPDDRPAAVRALDVWLAERHQPTASWTTPEVSFTLLLVARDTSSW